MSDTPFFERCERAWWDRFQEYERIALCTLADLEPEPVTKKHWADLSGESREKLLWAMRRAVVLGQECLQVLK